MNVFQLRNWPIEGYSNHVNGFFHLYLPSEPNGDWRPASRETPEQLAQFTRNFHPRHAMDYILDTFPIAKRKHEAKFNGDFRSKRLILVIYDAMRSATVSGIPYQAILNPHNRLVPRRTSPGESLSVAYEP